MSAEQRKQISDNTMKTTKVLIDENVAKDYLEHVLQRLLFLKLINDLVIIILAFL